MRSLILKPGLLWLFTFSGLRTVYEYQRVLHGIEATSLFYIVEVFAFPLILVWWLRAKYPNDPERPWGVCGYVFFTFWPFILPFYLFRKNRFLGLVEYIVVLGIFLFPVLAAMLGCSLYPDADWCLAFSI